MTYRAQISSLLLSRMAATPTSSTSSVSSSSEKRNQEEKISSSLRSSTSSMLILLVGVALALAMVVGVAEAKPVGDVFPPFSIRSNALKALKDLDFYASQHARPRYGKRFDAESGVGQKFAPTFSEASLIGSDRWVLINRDRPLTKLTESYLREILADNEKNNSADSEILGAA